MDLRRLDQVGRLTEQDARQHTCDEVLAGTSRLRREQLDPARLDAWKQARQVFSVVHEGVEMFARYQFVEVDGQLQPRDVIRKVLATWEPLHDPWAVAAWFFYPTRRLVVRDDGGVHNISPLAALERGLDDQVVRTAQLRLSGYVA